jgi:hypothetical protein
LYEQNTNGLSYDLHLVNMLALDGGKRKTNTIPKADWRLMHYMP